MFALQYVSCSQLFLGMYCRNEKKLFISYALKTKVKVKSLSRVGLFATPWTVAHQAPPSMGFSRQQYWSGLPFPSPQCDIPHYQMEEYKSYDHLNRCIKSI